MKVYVSGPMTGHKDFNFPAFEFAAASLRYQGHDVLSAHEIRHDEPNGVGSLEWDQYLRDDLKHMLDCHAIALLRGWPQSKGARLELSVALSLGMPVYYFDADTTRLMDLNR